MANRLNTAYRSLLGELRFEPRPQRVRVEREGRSVADTTDAYLVWEPRRIVPLFAVPWDDFTAELAKGDHFDPDLDAMPNVLPPGHFANHTCAGHLVTVDGLDGAAYLPDDPDLGSRVILDSGAFTWREEEDDVIGHPKDPFKRIDVLSSSRHIQVSLNGVVLAGSRRARMLLETPLPVRWYLPRDDVRLDLLTPTDTDTICPYKGHASYFSFEPAGDDGRDIAWSYVNALHDALPVEGYIAFFSERSDLRVDGELMTPPVTQWSKRV